MLMGMEGTGNSMNHCSTHLINLTSLFN